ncbi:hypothetical protein KSP39_PZI009834 [Platanthera zijinensis]|uniref:C2 domain-containing protein n=1 Tax=Platanthera zijinensis TaxID=2320716 RepID=A0AAP0BJF8_9ASPA
MSNLRLGVEVVGANDLNPKDGHGSSNPCVELQFDRQKSRTTVRENDLNPYWNEVFYFNVSDPSTLHDLSLEAVVYHIDMNTKSKSSIGKVHISGTSFVSHSESIVFYYPLEKNHVFSRTKGVLGLRVFLTGDPIHLQDNVQGISMEKAVWIREIPPPPPERAIFKLHGRRDEVGASKSRGEISLSLLFAATIRVPAQRDEASIKRRKYRRTQSDPWREAKQRIRSCRGSGVPLRAGSESERFTEQGHHRKPRSLRRDEARKPIEAPPDT